MSTERFLSKKADAYALFVSINDRIGDTDNICLGKNVKGEKTAKHQIAEFNDKNKDGTKREDLDYGFPVSFASKTERPESKFSTTYSVMYREHKLSISYKIHLSINRMYPSRDHISVDMVIHVPEGGICTTGSKIHRGDIYLKFHYGKDGEPSLVRKDKCFGDIRFKLPTDLQRKLRILLGAARASGVLRNYREDCDFRNTTESDVLGKLDLLDKRR
jgi:hypothetical protein